MRHFRILEIKNKNKYYMIQYQKTLIFGLSMWIKLNNDKYNKYDEALNEVKKIVEPSDYENSELVYHYVDAYKIFKNKNKQKQSI